MCLDIIDKEIKNITGIGYKVFDYTRDRHIKSVFVGNKRYKQNSWIKSSNEEIFINANDSYISGFHIFPDIQDAQRLLSIGIGCTYRKVQYKDVTASGMQNSRKVIVARKMYIYNKKETYAKVPKLSR